MRNASPTAARSSTARSAELAPGRGPALPVHGAAGSSGPAAAPHAAASAGPSPVADSPWNRRLARPAIILGATGAFLVAAQTFEPDWSRADDGTLGPTAMPVIVPAPDAGEPGKPANETEAGKTDPFSDGAVSLGRLEGIDGTTLILGHMDGPRWLELDADGGPIPDRTHSADGPPSALREAIAEAPVLLMRATGDVPGW